MACHCGHAEEEHGHDPKHPSSTACTVDNCGCIAFEEADEFSEGDRIADALENRGFYLKVAPTTAEDRANRRSPMITFWFKDENAGGEPVVIEVHD